MYSGKKPEQSLKRSFKMKKILLVVAITVLVLGALSVGVAFAQGQNPPVQPMMGGRGGYGLLHDYVEKELASRLNLSESQVEQEFAAGKTLAQIALDHGIQQADLATFLAEVHQAALSAAVKAGVITQAQADFMLQRMAFANCPMAGQGSAYGRSHGMMGGRWQTPNRQP
jgi:AraC-like DNA-binding protein